MRLNILITYDVSTTTRQGRKRLRQVAKACEAYGQRVQKSVFECRFTETQLNVLKLLRIINRNEDSLRFYRLPGDREQWVQAYGRDTYEVRHTVAFTPKGRCRLKLNGKNSALGYSIYLLWVSAAELRWWGW